MAKEEKATPAPAATKDGGGGKGYREEAAKLSSGKRLKVYRCESCGFAKPQEAVVASHVKQEH